MLISDNSPVRKNHFDSNRMRMQGYCDVYKWTILKRTSPEVKCLHPTSSRRKMCTWSVSNVIYHKFSHGSAFYTLNGKNVNIMLESVLIVVGHNLRAYLQLLKKMQIMLLKCIIHSTLTLFALGTTKTQ